MSTFTYQSFRRLLERRELDHSGLEALHSVALNVAQQLAGSACCQTADVVTYLGPEEVYVKAVRKQGEIWLWVLERPGSNSFVLRHGGREVASGGSKQLAEQAVRYLQQSESSATDGAKDAHWQLGERIAARLEGLSDGELEVELRPAEDGFVELALSTGERYWVKARPMIGKLGYSPEFVLAAYRIGPDDERQLLFRNVAMPKAAKTIWQDLGKPK